MRTGVTPFIMDGNVRRIPAAHIRERTRFPAG
jgi:hypothetical protein